MMRRVRALLLLAASGTAAGGCGTQWGWSAEFFGYDNGGRLDIYARRGAA